MQNQDVARASSKQDREIVLFEDLCMVKCSVWFFNYYLSTLYSACNFSWEYSEVSFIGRETCVDEWETLKTYSWSEVELGLSLLLPAFLLSTTWSLTVGLGFLQIYQTCSSFKLPSCLEQPFLLSQLSEHPGCSTRLIILKTFPPSPAPRRVFATIYLSPSLQ